MNIAFVTTTLFLLVFLNACSTAPKELSLRGDGDQVLNRDVNGKSLSVVVRIYQLKDAQEFSKLTFDTLASGHSEADLLGSALLSKTDAIVVPGGSYVSSEKLLDDTRFVGIVALFRNPDPYYWRQLVDATAIGKQGGGFNRNTELAFRVKDCYVMVTNVTPVALPGQPPNTVIQCGTAKTAGITQSAHAPNYGSQRSGQQLAAPSKQRQKAGWMPQGMPDVNINIANPVAPTSVRVGSEGVNAINIGQPPPVQPSPAPTYYNSPNYNSAPYYSAPR